MNFNNVIFSINWRQVLKYLSVYLAIAAIILYVLWPVLTGIAKNKRTLVLYGFSILGEVMTNGIYPAFNEEWQKKKGESIEFISSFSGSGTVTNQIIMGVPAEVAILSVELDTYRLFEKGTITDTSWKNLPYEGTLNLTPFIFLVRSGNPKWIKDFTDLTREGIGIIHPDPLTSGGAQWAILAEYGFSYLKGNRKDSYSILRDIWKNVISQAASARAARTQFNNGFGDVLITYEQEALYDKMRGRLAGEIVYPRSTIMSEHKVVVIDKNVSEEQRELVNSFVRFLWSEKAQKIFVKYGFRSINEKYNNEGSGFGKIEQPFTVKDLGGWKAAKKNIIDKLWKERILTEIKK
jgi:sulfate transport system substrate-binding protein